MMRIAKFGGSPIADAQQFHKVKHTIESDPARRFVVASASGREHKKDNRMTDLLCPIEAHLEYSVDHLSLLHLMEERFIFIKNDPRLNCPIEEDSAELRGQLNKAISTDYLASRGEHLTAKLMAEYLGFPFMDAKGIVTFRYDGKIDFDATKYRMDNAVKKLDRFVIPGSYGVLPDSTVHAMSRGGSDITGSILADILNADMYEDWTDVSGIPMADPRVVRHLKRINTITYSELRELSYMGASVLREEAIFPIKEKNIPINILSTNHPEEGSAVVAERGGHPSEQMVTGITGKKNFTIIAIYRNHMLDEAGIIRCALEICENCRISTGYIPSGIDPLSIVISSEDVKDIIYDMAGNTKKACNTDEIKIIDNISLIATVGRQMMYHPGIGGKLFAVLGKNNIDIRMTVQGAGEMNIVVGVKNKDHEKTVGTIYDNFIVWTHRVLHNSRIQSIQIGYEGRVK